MDKTSSSTDGFNIKLNDPQNAALKLDGQIWVDT